jgi:3-methyladenine DNA glycosylase AlkD
MKRTKAEKEKLKLARWTLAHREALNNWDLVDVSVPILIGGLPPTPEWTKTVRKLLISKRLWDRRIAMVSTLGWMRQGSLDACFLFAEQLLNDQEDLMHKAVGWMLREAGKRDRARLCLFLDHHAGQMPRTALRYALEHLPPSQRAFYMARKRASV